jgi:ABC-2 type transport system permease protein
MMRGLWQLTWLEIKIFMREPLGAIGTLLIPVALFLMLGRAMNRGLGRPRTQGGLEFMQTGLPVMVSVFMAISAVISLVTIISIYREGGILKRLRATPLRPYTILTAHVVVKLIFTGVTLGLMAMAGRRFYPVALDVPWIGFALALLVTTVSIQSMGFLVASLVPTARFAQPIGSVIFYPMLAVSGLFVPTAGLPASVQPVAEVLPLTFAVSLLRGIWIGEGWVAHLSDVGVLVGIFVVCTAISTRVFRWE